MFVVYINAFAKLFIHAFENVLYHLDYALSNVMMDGSFNSTPPQKPPIRILPMVQT